MENLYVIYGRNLNRERMLRCCPNANPIAVATLHDYQLVFQDSSHGVHANIIPMKGQEVPVVIWDLSADDECHLDADQWYGYGGCTKEYVDIVVDGETQQAKTYIMYPAPYGIPTDTYLKTIAEGYLEFGLPIKILNDALVRSYEDMVTNEGAENTVLRPAR